MFFHSYQHQLGKKDALQNPVCKVTAAPSGKTMETYVAAKGFVDNPDFAKQRQKALIEPISLTLRDQEIEYRIAYIAMCVENSSDG